MDFTLKTLSVAISALENQTSVELKDVATAFPDQLQYIANLTGNHSTNACLERGDLFALLARPELYSSNANLFARSIKQFLKLPEDSPDVVVAYQVITDAVHHGEIAVYKLTPKNLEPNLEPIVFTGGMFHGGNVYLPFLQKMATKTGREILVYDQPGVGNSLYPEQKIDFPTLRDALPLVLKNVFAPETEVIFMAHSMGTIALRFWYFHQKELVFHIKRFVAIAPVPAREEEKTGLVFSKKFKIQSAKQLLTTGKLKPTADMSQKLFYNKHSHDQFSELWEKIAMQEFRTSLLNFLKALQQVNAYSLLQEPLGDQLEMIIADQDNTVQLKDENFWQNRNAVILKGADHSFMAEDPDLHPVWMGQILKTLDTEKTSQLATK